MSYTDRKITQEEINAHHVQGATDYLIGNPQQNKAVFDNLPEFIAGKFNDLIDEIAGQHGDEIKVAVDEWLAEHPEVTTTVQDNSLTTAKYVDGSVTEPKIGNGAVTPSKLDRAYSTPADLASVNANLTNELNVLDARMDEFASLPEGSTTADAELMDIRVGADGTIYPTAGDAVRGQINGANAYADGIAQEVTAKMQKVESHNLISDDDFTNGYVAQNGTVYSSSSIQYTDKITVTEGDVIRVYAKQGGVFGANYARFLCAYDADGNAVSASGAENIGSYTVPSGIASIVLSVFSAYTEWMVTKNYETTEYEEYFQPYYLSTYDFIKDVLPPVEIPEMPVKGTSLVNAYEVGDGFYDRNGSGKATKYNYTGYKYAKIPVKQNTWYYFSCGCRTLLLCDENDNVLTYFGSDLSPETRRIVNSGNATVMYYTATSGQFNPNQTKNIVSEGINGVNALMKRPQFVSGLTQRTSLAMYGNALPRVPLYLMAGIDEVWYTKNMMALPSNIVYLYEAFGGYTSKGSRFNPSNVGYVSNNYGFSVYDENFALVDEKDRNNGGEAYVMADNVQNASVLTIGDSTVAQVVMLQKMADGFTSRGKTLTLLGTCGTTPIKHEGRSGWSAKNYCIDAEKGGVTNAFFNPTTEKFDFSYYMTNQGYSAVDFVVIQLGINDLYGMDFDFANAQATIEETAGYVIEMIDSILAFNPSQKILLNLPAAINEDQSKHTQFMPIVRNKVVRYNEYMQALATQYDMSKVRCSYCHLILDPETDIRDDVHPTDAGYAKMGMEVVSQINCWQNNY